MGSLQIDILGTSFSIKASEDDKYLRKLFGYYKKIIEEIQKSGMMRNDLHISILAGIMLCDELYKEKSKTAKSTQQAAESESDEMEKLAAKMIERLDLALSTGVKD